MFGYLFSMLYFSWSVNIARVIELQTRTTIEQFNGIRWDPVFILNGVLFLFMHRPWGLDLILYWKTHNYRKVILLNFKMFLCA